MTRWIKRVNTRGWEGLKEKKGRGRKGFLTGKQKNWLRKIFKKKPIDIGYYGEKWEGKKVKLLIKQKFGFDFGKSRVYEFMKKFKK